MVGWNIEDGEIIGSEYKLKVLSLNNSVLYASLSWLRTRGAINQIDLESFEALKKLRNSLAHNLPKLVLQGINFKIEDNFQKLFDLLRKIEVWWIVEFEIPTNPDFDGKDIDVDKITPGPIIMMQMMLEVLSGNEDLLKHYKEHNPPSVEYEILVLSRGFVGRALRREATTFLLDQKSSQKNQVRGNAKQ